MSYAILRCDSKENDNKKIWRLLSLRFLSKIAWMFVGYCKRVWYKIRIHFHFQIATKPDWYKRV